MRSTRSTILAIGVAGVLGFGAGVSAVADPPTDPVVDEPDMSVCLPEHDRDASPGSPGEKLVPVDLHPCWAMDTPNVGTTHTVLVGNGWGLFSGGLRLGFAEAYQGTGNGCDKDVGTLPFGHGIELKLASVWNLDSSATDGGEVAVAWSVSTLQFGATCSGIFTLTENLVWHRGTTVANIDWTDVASSAPSDIVYAPTPSGAAEDCYEIKMRTCVCNVGTVPSTTACLAGTASGCTDFSPVVTGTVQVHYVP
jgi:hypothetical protein